MSPRSLSLSDGEVSSEDGEKVTKNTSYRTSTSVNNSARHSSSSRPSQPAGRRALMSDMSAHFTGYGKERERSRSPFRRDRSGSRSPYRAHRDSGREKRRRQDDHYGKGSSDPRRHKVYEEPSRTSPDDRRGGRPRADTRDSYGSRDRSRSPYRASNNNARPVSRSSAQAGAGSEAVSKQNDMSTDGTQKSGKPEAEVKASEPTEEPAEPVKQLSDAELIEERRKKREAIRKKHAAASASDSLLRTTLESNLPSTATTPYNESSGHGSAPQSPPSSINSPRTPMDVSYPGSPASPGSPAIITDADLVNPIELDANEDHGQSAADYDPNQDMNEDRPDHKRQEQMEDAANEQVSTVKASVAAQKPADEFDMFADDDDDMFAADDAPATSNAPKQAKALDESLLDNWDYPDGHYRIINGELLDGRYAVEQQIGKGTFATVVRATDAQSGKKVAIKIACRNDTMFKAGQKEMQFLNRLNEADPEDKKCIIRLLADFMHKGHLCLVFEGLEMDLRETLKKFGRDIGINPEAIQIYARQMFLALLHMKNTEVLHADLKPDNILVSSDNKLVKICDFGTATLQQDAELTPYLVSRFYRAPEVIMGMEFDYAIDMWSIGCTLYELYTGRILFNGADNNNMLRVIQECRGKLPNRLIKKSQLAGNYFDEQFVFHGLERDKMTGNIVPKPMHFSQGVTGKDLKSRLSANVKKMDNNQLKLHSAFVDLLDKCLQLDPEKRIKPKDALRHSFVSGSAREPLAPAKSAKTNSVPKGFRPAVVQRAG
ncbi:putative serine/threonine-protein kinase, active [Septoria linicola]|nr:putative serine/threonine-protein kinase, active [Septoria linicola]